MKKFLLLSINLVLIILSANATVHVVQVSSNQFSPATIPNVFVGDIIRWEWVNGFHTTTCDPNEDPNTSLPAGAATWNETMSSGSSIFEYTVTTTGNYVYVCLPHSPNMTGSFTVSAVQPVKLTAFQITGSKEKVTLSWNTENEINTDYFSVRRSLDGNTYTEVGRVPANGNATESNTYTFTDKISSKNRYYYYNLAVVDKDGRKMYSDTRVFKNNDIKIRLVQTLSPNPISRPGHLNMTFNAEQKGKMEVRVINAEGKTINTTTLQAFAGVTHGHVHLGELPPGTYTLQCSLNGIKETHKIIYR